MLAGVQDWANAWALCFGRTLPVVQLSESNNRVKRCAKYVTDTRKEFGFGFARPLDFFDALSLSDVLHSALVIEDRPGHIADRTCVFAQPHFGSVFAVGLVLKQFHHTVRLDKTFELFPARRIDVGGLSNVADLGDDFLG